MDSVVEKLNYNFNFHLHHFNMCIRDRLSDSDRRLAVAWINKLKSEGISIDEAHLRNDLVFYLVKSAEDGCLKPPFHQNPPQGRLLNIRSILPPEMKVQMGNAPSQSQPKPEIFERSPDKGAFLASQPVPRSGAFCYLAIGEFQVNGKVPNIPT